MDLQPLFDESGLLFALDAYLLLKEEETGVCPTAVEAAEWANLLLEEDDAQI